MNLTRFAWGLFLVGVALLILGFCTSRATPQCLVRHRRFPQAAVVVAQSAAVVAPVVQVPAYGATYDDQAATANLLRDLHKRIADLEARAAQLETARDNLSQRLAVIEGKHGIATPPPVMPKADEKPKPQAKPAARTDGKLPVLVARSCVHCHTGAKAAGGLLLDSAEALAKLTAEQRLDMIRRINLETTDKDVMPRQQASVGADVKKPATDEEAAELLDYLTRR